VIIGSARPVVRHRCPPPRRHVLAASPSRALGDRGDLGRAQLEVALDIVPVDGDAAAARKKRSNFVKPITGIAPPPQVACTARALARWLRDRSLNARVISMTP